MSALPSKPANARRSVGSVSPGRRVPPGNLRSVISASPRATVPHRGGTTGPNSPVSRLSASPNRPARRPARRMTSTVRAVAMLAMSALLLAQCGGDPEEPADGDEGTATTLAAPATTAAAPPPSATQVATPEPPPPAAPAAAAPAAAPAPAPAPPALSGPPPVAVGSMLEMRVAADGLAHARFVAEFFGGPVDGYSASSSDNGVATAGVQSPDLLVVAPVSDGSASVTVTASGPGGTATQTFTVQVGSGSDQSRFADATASAPAASTPAPPPARDEPASAAPTEEAPADDAVADDAVADDAAADDAAADDAAADDAAADDAVADDAAADDAAADDAAAEDAVADDSDADDIPTEALPPLAPTERPALAGTIPEQAVLVGESRTLDAGPYFSGIVQGWSVGSSAPAVVSVLMRVPGVVTLTGAGAGTANVTVTAENNIGSVAQAFRVSVTTTADSADAAPDSADAAPDSADDAADSADDAADSADDAADSADDSLRIRLTSLCGFGADAGRRESESVGGRGPVRHPGSQQLLHRCRHRFRGVVRPDRLQPGGRRDAGWLGGDDPGPPNRHDHHHSACNRRHQQERATGHDSGHQLTPAPVVSGRRRRRAVPV